MLKYYEMPPKQRINYLKELGINEETFKLLKPLSTEKANLIIENVIGTINLPLAVTPNIKINDKFYAIPMAIEEPSIVAGFSKAAKMTLPNGFKAYADKSIMIGQIQIKANDHKKALSKLKEHEKEITAFIKSLTKHIEKYGGGFEAWDYYLLPTFRGNFIIIRVLINVADAQGANTINTVCEELGKELQNIGIGEYRLRILSNLSIYRKAYAEAHWSFENIEKDAKKKGFKAEEAVEHFLDGYAFALHDVFRVTTNNKGIMNGVDALALATGQDFRAIEAGAHMYSAIKGNKPLAQFKKAKDGGIEGFIELPMPVAMIGGATKVLPHAQFSLKLLNVKSSQELAAIFASVGLANNFAALYALSTEGINKGHMKLHAKQLAIMAGANEDEIKEIMKRIENKKINFSTIKELLEEIRG